MENLNRRELGLALSAFAFLGGVTALAQEPGSLPETAAPETRLVHSALFAFDKLPVKTAANGAETRSVFRGTLATGEYVEVHETMLPAGQMPHPPHRHTHSEMLLIRAGKLEVTSDGQRGIVNPGDVIFTASAVLHGLKNIGDGPASYFVVAVGLQKVLP